MRILYATDLHGNESKYKKLLKKAIKLKADIVINGGDMFPKNIDLTEQDQWISKFLSKHLKKYEDTGIKYVCIPANDDLIAFDPLFENTVGLSGAFPIAGRLVKIDGWSLIGFNLVPDYPFRLKDRCRMDTRDCLFEKQLGTGVLSSLLSISSKAVLMEISGGWINYAMSLPTIKEELEKLPVPELQPKTIYVMHSPPCGIGLDMCRDKRAVGSRAIRDFILKNQPAMTLHGHIHESVEETNRWRHNIGNTICIQPGQMKLLSYVVIDIDGEKIEAKRIEE